MAYLANLAVGQKFGLPRVWLQSKALEKEGFSIGERFDVDLDAGRAVIKIRISESGARIVSRKKSGTSEIPVIELHNNSLAEWLPAHAKRVRVCAKSGVIEITVHRDDDAALDRLDALKERLAAGKPLRVGEVAVGGGVMSDALHQGFKDSGIDSQLSFAIEKESVYLSQFVKTCRSSTKETLFIESGMEDVDVGELPSVDILAAGIPCVGASLQGRTSKKLSCAEACDSSGALFFSWLAIVKACNPSVVLLENVPQWANTASQMVIRSCLSQWGYEISEGELSRETGGFEDRHRFCMVAVTKGLNKFEFKDLLPSAPTPSNFASIMESVPSGDPMWKEYRYIWDKLERDKKKKSGFAPFVIDANGSATKVNTIVRNYAKVQSSGALVKHPTNQRLYRLLTPLEHCKAKAVPERIIEGLSNVVAHQILGQSVLYPAFRSVARLLASLISDKPQLALAAPINQPKKAAIVAFPDKHNTAPADVETGQLALNF